MDGVFASDKARLRPPPSFLTAKGSPSSAAAEPSAAGSSSASAAAVPLPPPTSSATAAKLRSTSSPTSLPSNRFTMPAPRFGQPHSRPTPASEFRSVPVGRSAGAGGVGESPPLREASSTHHSTVTSTTDTAPPPPPPREQHSRPRTAAGPASAHRTKSPLVTSSAAARKPGAKASGYAGRHGVSGSGKRRPTELEAAKEQVEKMKHAIDGYKRDVAQLEEALETQQRDYEAELQRQHEEAQEAVDHLAQELDDLEAKRVSEIRTKDREIEQRDAEISSLKEKMVEQQRFMQQRIEAITEEANARIDEYEQAIHKFQDEVARQEGVIQDRNNTIKRIEQERDARYQQYEEYLMIGEKSRAELHNALIELKGNIRVFARVRPMLEKEVQAKQGDDSTHFHFPEGTDHRTLHVVDVPGHQSAVPGKSEPTKTLPFTFDKVFGPVASQESVFDDISQLVQSSLDGYKVCIFAYGQTGSGKTYTMEGPDPSREGVETGMIARAVNQIFDNTKWKSKQTGFTFRLLCSFLEIYNETVHDLLNSRENYGNADSTTNLKHEIRIQDGEATVTNINEEEVTGPHHVYDLLRIANENRKTAGTKMNERASRSHSVFIMKIRGYNEATRQEINGQLNLIDLAGSERLAKSKAEGDRLRETQYINKSLACLGDVIAALAKGDGAHVPFRQSKLTHLLQPSMTNESKTLMFVNLNPIKDHLHESLCSLRFAAKVNACEIGLARRKVTNK